ncbi:MAG: tRNA (adenosine(37)-N6)-threonylcarbamoyltransferase complex dimerization subunit type 1 TsaB [Actinobacteria bacterium]|nr:tRNA (adenosine(37)-N6)-threonylcarbamoyltransferase complex dimerization subunit type 1 TsaB [Actinomycetota bacterium]
MYVLSIDSTTKKLTVDLSRDGKIISGISDNKCLKHMEKIMTHIDHVVKEGHIDLDSIDVLGINAGPGDFTGTRIGISIIKTLSWVLNRPAYGINALDVFALGIARSNARHISKSLRSGTPVIVAPCLDVRKEELYYSFYEVAMGEEPSRDIKENNYRPVSDIIVGDYTHPLINISGNHLVQKDLFNEKISSLFREKDFHLSDGEVRTYKDAKLIIGGNCLNNYKVMLSGLAGNERRIILDKKNTEPAGNNLSECIDFLVKRKEKPERINPVYVREFAPFGK